MLLFEQVAIKYQESKFSITCQLVWGTLLCHTMYTVLCHLQTLGNSDYSIRQCAFEILEGLLHEDDEVVAVWYLMGWLHHLTEDADSARFYLEQTKAVSYIPH